METQSIDGIGESLNMGTNEILPATGAVGEENSTRTPGNNDALLAMQLPMSISFGRARMPLRDVLKLQPGSVVELDQSAYAAIELVVNNSVVATGDLVIVDGQYAVRIQEVTGQPKLGSPSSGPRPKSNVL